MFSFSLLSLTGISQLTLFLGIGLLLFGWIEKKEKLIIGSQMVFLLFGLFALWIILGEVVSIPTPVGDSISKEVKLLGFFKSSIILMGISFVSILLNLFKIRFRKTGDFAVLMFALFLFFMIFSIQQLPA